MFVIYTDCISPHQVPVAKELVKLLGVENFRYVYRDRVQADRVKTGWTMDGDEPWMVWMGERGEKGESGERGERGEKGERGENWRELVENCEVLYTGFREVELFERRAEKGLKTFYVSERWFKPLAIVHLFGSFGFAIPGWLRMASPGYRRRARRIAKLMKEAPNFYYLPIGTWAAKDMMRLGVPTDKMISWGYFVEPGCQKEHPIHDPIRVLYVGRLIPLKCVDTIIRAVAAASKNRPMSLTIVGDGPERAHLERLSRAQFNQPINQSTNQPVSFLGSLPIATIRSVMRDHDVLVFSSNAFDGWGAVVSEALEEGMRVIGTRETGASAAVLPEACLYSCGNWRELADKLSQDIPYVGIGSWTAATAARKLFHLL